tara:strand:- start:904 stop:1101 length:198 start_codon:yes stop_codon:yes gene_type:complete
VNTASEVLEAGSRRRHLAPENLRRSALRSSERWIDEAGLDAAFGAANAKFTASLAKRQQEMQQQQ